MWWGNHKWFPLGCSCLAPRSAQGDLHPHPIQAGPRTLHIACAMRVSCSRNAFSLICRFAANLVYVYVGTRTIRFLCYQILICSAPFAYFVKLSAGLCGESCLDLAFSGRVFLPCAQRVIFPCNCTITLHGLGKQESSENRVARSE
jgi:hypothetical protein